MNLMSIEGISKSYTEKVLLKNVSFSIEDDSKIGLIGINGTGKSTLLKILAGIETVDEGNIIKRKDMQVHYLPQNPSYDSERTVINQIFDGEAPILKLIREYEEVVEKLKTDYEDVKLQNRLTQLTSQMDSLNAWQLESEAKKVLSKLGIENFNQKVGTLSGGQRKRVFLAQALIRPSELLILDEPTNHLDNDVIDWLEEYLKNRKGALIMITHDRYFLDRVVNEIVEIFKGGLYKYKGNYSLFLEKKAEREQNLINAESKRKSLYKKELEWIRTGAKARTTKQKARIDRFEAIKEGKIDTNFNEKIDISVGSRRLGKKVIDINNVSLSFEDKNIITDFEYVVGPNERIGVVGENGIGKSSLLNLITGKYECDKGTLDIGETVKIGYYSQSDEDMDENMRVIDYIKEESEMISTSDGKYITASQMLEKFLFPPDIQYTFIGKLSGGERRRLYLLRVLMSNPNVLLLDEPTNDLDVYTLTILEEYIEAFQGVVIVVSHDRYFLDKVADKIFAFEGKGIIKQYTGNYFDYCDMKKKENKEVKKEISDKKSIDTNKENKKKNKLKTKLSFKEQREYETIPGLIEELENELEEITKSISKAGSDYVLLQELTSKQEEVECKLLETMERFEELENLVEEIEKNKVSN